VNPYAAELARVTVWIGELQWQMANGYGVTRRPILGNLDGIENKDALLNADGSETQWPPATVIIGNPPFLGNKRMLSELGKAYVDQLRAEYAQTVPGTADLVMYWFDKARREILTGRASATGLVSTNSIRGLMNRPTLEAICKELNLFDVWSDEPWAIDGAAVRVSLVCFAKRGSFTPIFNGVPGTRG
jgi:type II restriction/modification system DNA methylase subunit YeeA